MPSTERILNSFLTDFEVRRLAFRVRGPGSAVTGVEIRVSDAPGDLGRPGSAVQQGVDALQQTGHPGRPHEGLRR